MASGKKRKRAKIAWRTLLYGALAGTAALILLILLFTLFIYLGWLKESAIPIGNTVIKIAAAIAAGVCVGLARDRIAWYFGGVAALLSLTVAAAAMGVYLGSFRFTWSLAADLLMGFAIGSAAAAVFLKRKKE